MFRDNTLKFLWFRFVLRHKKNKQRNCSRSFDKEDNRPVWLNKYKISSILLKSELLFFSAFHKSFGNIVVDCHKNFWKKKNPPSIDHLRWNVSANGSKFVRVVFSLKEDKVNGPNPESTLSFMKLLTDAAPPQTRHVFILLDKERKEKRTEK